MNTTGRHSPRLPQLHGRPMVTDGGMETDLIFHHGVDLPCFAAFPLVEAEGGRPLLEDYYDGYAAVARRAGAGLMLESPTWRANPDWGERLGYGPADLARVNAAAIATSQRCGTSTTRQPRFRIRLHQMKIAEITSLSGKTFFALCR